MTDSFGLAVMEADQNGSEGVGIFRTDCWKDSVDVNIFIMKSANPIKCYISFHLSNLWILGLQAE